MKKRCCQDILRTPLRDNSGKPDLFRVISNVGTEAEYGVAEMSIGTPDNLWLLHVWPERLKDDLQTIMIELTTKLLELNLFSLAFACYKIMRVRSCNRIRKAAHTFWDW
jgi:hypothetical protein